MATRLEKLMFRLGVKDDASGPVGKLQKALRSTSRMSKQAWGQLAGGAMTAAGAGLALEGMVSPALDLNRALADVSSLDVDAKGLKLLDATAKQYAMSYGGTAAEFVASSYAIQSGIAGLDASQLADFTRASNVLAKATKADAATMTNYAGTMYGIFNRPTRRASPRGLRTWPGSPPTPSRFSRPAARKCRRRSRRLAPTRRARGSSLRSRWPSSASCKPP